MTDRKRALVSGGSRGIGRAIALDLATDHEVVTFARGDVVDAVDDPRGRGITHLSGVDVRRIDTATEIEPYLDSVDILVNNVGVAFDGILATQSFESIQDTVQVNLLSVLYLAKRYVRARLAVNRPGCILNVGSIVGIRGFSGLVAYSASKAAVEGMTRALAREMGGRGFRVNAILPGYVETEMSASLTDTGREQIVRRTPLGRLARVEDIVPVVRFLVSDGAGFVTGQSVIVDGGASV
ncbi:SDR family oxidoreductase [bacterium]|nr:SDR family oxidoreductase [bacterium]